MLQMPQRSVTRFFIPLIDVLILLFSIYLLMPMVAAPEGPAAENKQLREQVEKLEQKLQQGKAISGKGLTAELIKEIEELRKAKAQALANRVALRVLDFDEEGRLWYQDGDSRIQVKNENVARRLIAADKEKVKERYGEKRELLYVLRYPPRDKDRGLPSPAQLREYRKWFEGVALALETPGQGPGGAS
jgi:hypothetical protein